MNQPSQQPTPNRSSDDAADVARRRPPLPSIVRDLRELVELGATFASVYADPPWPYSNTAARGAAENHYRTEWTVYGNQVERRLF